VPEMSDEGNVVVATIRKRYLNILYAYIHSSGRSEECVEENDVYAAVRVGSMLVLNSSIMVSI
jgi:hypothetical protein